MEPDRSKDLKSIEEIPIYYRSIFSQYPYFNIVQSTVFDDVFHSDKSVVVSAPTGSGKTVIFELAIVKLLIANELEKSDNLVKIIYISPIKALCQERLVDWHQKFLKYGLNCVSVTGDSDFVDFSRLQNHNFIITTPEKWDSVTRKWKDNVNLVNQIKLFLIDEVHLLHEDKRGPILEVIVNRMKTIENDTNIQNKIRYLAVSATVPNIEDVSEWIGGKNNSSFFQLTDEMRPVPLKKIVIGFNFDSKNNTYFKFDLSLNYRLQNLLLQYSKGKPTLIFCNTRKSVEMTAKHIVQNVTINLNEQQKSQLLNIANSLSDNKAKETLIHGVAYHHAGMMPETKHAVENLFRNRDLPILVTTSTLAMGVNLPAHLVIIKSTKCYNKSGFEDYSETAIMQMIGRAGRPQFDTSGTAIIMTTVYDKRKYEQMIGGTQPIESNLHKHLDEHLNAEVVLGTIKGLDIAMQWLSSTFLYIRARKNPRHYRLATGLTVDQMDKKLLEMCQIQLNKLVRVGMLTIDENIRITPTELGIIMAKYCIAFETMSLFTKIKGTEVLQQILAIISKCHEFSELYLRTDDKKCLNLLNKNKNNKTIRFPLNGKIKTLEMKTNCIIQAVLGSLHISDQSILADAQKIMRNGERVIKCLIEFLGTRDKCFSALLNSVILAKCFRANLWENSPYVSRQLSGIGAVLSNQLVNAGKTSFQKILETNPRDLEMILNKKSPWGNRIIDEVKHIPKYNLSIDLNNKDQVLKVKIELLNKSDIENVCTGNDSSLMSLLIGDSDNDILLYEQYSHSYMMDNPEIIKHINIDNPNVEEIQAHFLSEQWVGVDCNARVHLKNFEDKPKPSSQGNNTYMQMFMDMYMKVKKKVPLEKKSIRSSGKLTNKTVKPKSVQRTLSDFLNKNSKQPMIENNTITEPIVSTINESGNIINMDYLHSKAAVPEKRFDSNSTNTNVDVFGNKDNNYFSPKKSTYENKVNPKLTKTKSDEFENDSNSKLDSQTCDSTYKSVVKLSKNISYNKHNNEELIVQKDDDTITDNKQENLCNKIKIYDNVLLKCASSVKPFPKQKLIESVDIVFEDLSSSTENSLPKVLGQNEIEITEKTYKPEKNIFSNLENHSSIQNISSKYGLASCKSNTSITENKPTKNSFKQLKNVVAPSSSQKRNNNNSENIIHSAMKFENALHNEDTKTYVTDFQFNGRKRLSHEPDSTEYTDIQSASKKKNVLPCPSKPNIISSTPSKSLQRTKDLRESSFSKDKCSTHIRHKYGWGNSQFKKLGTNFPLGDKDYEDVRIDKPYNVPDICTNLQIRSSNRLQKDILSTTDTQEVSLQEDNNFVITQKSLEFHPKEQIKLKEFNNKTIPNVYNEESNNNITRTIFSEFHPEEQDRHEDFYDINVPNMYKSESNNNITGSIFSEFPTEYNLDCERDCSSINDIKDNYQIEQDFLSERNEHKLNFHQNKMEYHYNDNFNEEILPHSQIISNQEKRRILKFREEEIIQDIPLIYRTSNMPYRPSRPLYSDCGCFPQPPPNFHPIEYNRTSLSYQPTVEYLNPAYQRNNFFELTENHEAFLGMPETIINNIQNINVPYEERLEDYNHELSQRRLPVENVEISPAERSRLFRDIYLTNRDELLQSRRRLDLHNFSQPVYHHSLFPEQPFINRNNIPFFNGYYCPSNLNDTF